MRIKTLKHLQFLITILFFAGAVSFLGIYGDDPDVAQADSCSTLYNAAPVWSPDGEYIAYIHVCDGHATIWLIRPDGSENTRLSPTDDSFDSFVTWSPDGQRLGFISEGDGFQNLWVVNRDGSNPKNLTRNMLLASLRHPTWSPDGRTIAFEASKDNSDNKGVWIVSVDTHGFRQITPDDDFAYTRPSWSPDSQQLVISAYNAGTKVSQLWVIDVPGLDMTRVTPVEFVPFEGRWSPVDDRIATSDPREGIWITSSTGTLLVNLTAGQKGFDPVWSPDGEFIAFQVSSGGLNIFRIDSDGLDPRNLTQQLAGDSVSPSWAPDASKIAFVYYDGVSQEIWIMDADGSNPLPLTNNTSDAS